MISDRSSRERGWYIFYQTDPIIQFILGGGGLFVLKQWISSLLKHDTVPRVGNLYCLHVKPPIRRLEK